MPKGIYPRQTGYRPRKTDLPELVDKVRLLYANGKTQTEIAVRLGMSQKGVQGIFRRNGITARVAAKRDQRGPLNSSWKGDRAGYQAMHLRLYAVRGQPFPCSVCGTMTAKAYDWANLTGHYSDLTDYSPMCRSCHRKYDGGVKNLR
jgi:hypothetical protein